MPGGNEQFTRKELDDLAPFVAIYGAKGLAYIRVNDPSKLNEEGLQSPIVKFLSPEVLGKIIERTGAKAGDVLFFGADRRKVVNDALGALRSKVGHEKGHAETGVAAVLGARLPRVRVRRGQQALGRRAPSVHRAQGRARGVPRHAIRAKVLAKAYDIAMNGWELGGGSVRIHRAEIQAKQFAALGIGAGGAAREVRLPARCARLRRAAARRHRLRPRPHGGDARGRGPDPRRDRVPEDAARPGPHGRGAEPVTEKQLRELHIKLRNTGRRR